MKNLILLLIFTISPLLLFAQETSRYWENLYEGSQDEKELLSFLTDYLDQEELSYRIRNYQDEELLHSFGSSLEITQDRSGQHHLILVFPLQSSIFGDPVKMDFVLALINRIKDSPSEADISLLFLTGEDQEVPVGTTVYLDNINIITEQTGLIYLNLEGGFSNLTIKAGSQNQVSSLWLSKELVNRLYEQNIEAQIDNWDLQIQRTRFSSMTEYITPYLKHGISSVLLSSKNSDDKSGDFDALLNSLLLLYDHYESLQTNLTDENYFLFHFKNKPYFFDESSLLLIFLGCFSIILLIILFQYRKVLVNLKKFRNQSWMVVLSFFMLLVFLMLSTLLMEELGYIFNDSLIWLSVPLPAFVLKIMLTFIFASFFLFTLRGIPIPRSPHFYSYNAYFMAFMNLILLSIIEITLTYFWIWALLFTIIFTQSRKRWVKVICLATLPVPFVLGLYALMQGNYPEVQNFLIGDRMTGNLFLAINLLPFILMLSSLHYYRYYYHKERLSLVGPITLGVSALLALGLLSFFVIEKNQIIEANRMVKVNENISLDSGKRTLYLNSDRAIGTLNLNWDGKVLNLNNLGKTAEIEQEPPSDWFQMDMEENLFLDRRYLQFQLYPKGAPDLCYISLESTESFTIYDCTYPFEMNPQGTQAHLLIGKYPPSPLPLSITINRNAQVVIKSRFSYSRWPETIEIKNLAWSRETLELSQILARIK